MGRTVASLDDCSAYFPAEAWILGPPTCWMCSWSPQKISSPQGPSWSGASPVPFRRFQRPGSKNKDGKAGTPVGATAVPMWWVTGDEKPF